MEVRSVFEQRGDRLAGRDAFISRQLKFIFFSLLILTASIGIGVVGYHLFGKLPWIDAFLNASMILTGMGPVDRLDTTEGKLFASFYALFSGVSFLTFVGVLFAPVYHRFLHKFHLDENEARRKKRTPGGG
jgi:hypothetical protein